MLLEHLQGLSHSLVRSLQRSRDTNALKIRVRCRAPFWYIYARTGRSFLRSSAGARQGFASGSFLLGERVALPITAVSWHIQIRVEMLPHDYERLEEMAKCIDAKLSSIQRLKKVDLLRSSA